MNVLHLIEWCMIIDSKEINYVGNSIEKRSIG